MSFIYFYKSLYHLFPKHLLYHYIVISDHDTWCTVLYQKDHRESLSKAIHYDAPVNHPRFESKREELQKKINTLLDTWLK